MTLEQALQDCQKAYDSLCSIPDEELSFDANETVDNVAKIQKALIRRLETTMESTSST